MRLVADGVPRRDPRRAHEARRVGSRRKGPPRCDGRGQIKRAEASPASARFSSACPRADQLSVQSCRRTRCDPAHMPYRRVTPRPLRPSSSTSRKITML